MEVAYKDVVSFYGEDPTSTKPDDFFGIFKLFLASFEHARNDNKVQQERAAQKKKKEEIAERVKKEKTPSPDVKLGTDESGEKDIMDNLLETLRNGDATSRRRERRLNRSTSVSLRAEDLLKSLKEKEDAPPLPKIPDNITEITAE